MKLVAGELNHTLPSQDVLTSASSLLPYVQALQRVSVSLDYEQHESSIALPTDQALLAAVSATMKKAVPADDILKHIVVVGVGGSNLGTKAVYDACGGFFDSIEPHRIPKMHFIDTIDSRALVRLKEFLPQAIAHKDELLIVLVTKSGTTTETLYNYDAIVSALPYGQKRTVVITNEASPLARRAQEEKMFLLTIPPKVGGRYSVMSAVGLLPLMAAGINVNALRQGAEEMRQQCLAQDPLKNPAAMSASLLYLQWIQGRIIHDTFLFHPELESLGKWYRQLLAESLGKEKDREGNIVNIGITPTVSIGSTDLHSIEQLYLGGPDNRFMTLVRVLSDAMLHRSSQGSVFSDLVPGIQNKPAHEVLDAIFTGVEAASRSLKRPYVEIQLTDISPQEIGAFMQFKMMEVMYLAQLLNINAFDQPNIELYKEATRRLLIPDA